MTEAGLIVREDTIGNVYGVLEGSDPTAPAVGTGSHCDAIPLAGAFDGTLGALRRAVRFLGAGEPLRGWGADQGGGMGLKLATPSSKLSPGTRCGTAGCTLPRPAQALCQTAPA